MKKIVQTISEISGLSCEHLTCRWKHKHLPPALKYSPQHLVYTDEKVRLVYFKSSYDSRFIEMGRDEVSSLRFWDAYITPVIVVVWNYIYQRYTSFRIPEINRKVSIARKESINIFLLVNADCEWKTIEERMEL